jgi:hypothetical protein
MRVMLRARMDVEAGNRAIRDGSLAETIERVMKELEPEAAYFVAEGGKRTALIFFDLKEPSQIPSVAEPFFMTLNASVDLTPAMTPDDVRAGLQAAAGAF